MKLLTRIFSILLVISFSLLTFSQTQRFDSDGILKQLFERLSDISTTTPRPTSTSTGTKCGSEYFYCAEDHRCISRKLICDRKNDCSGGSDEEKCRYPTETERDTKFICNNGQVTNYWSFCYGGNQCIDKSDELKCDFRGKKNACSPGQFSCTSDGRCIDGSWRMDGVADCDDNSDEDNYIEMPQNLTDLVKACERTDPNSNFKKGHSIHSNHDYFLCNVGSSSWKCFPNTGVCAGGNQCPNGEDERDCQVTGSMHDYKFHCRNGERVSRNQRCDGTSDCADRSDEINCYKLDSYDHSFNLRYPL